MTEEFREDFGKLCAKYDGFTGVLEQLADWERETANKIRNVKPANNSEHYDWMADKLLEPRDYWVSF
jgi:hypothetical protein